MRGQGRMRSWWSDASRSQPRPCWMPTSSRSAAEQQAAWDFMKYVTSPAVQAQWQSDTGYFPMPNQPVEALRAPVRPKHAVKAIGRHLNPEGDPRADLGMRRVA